MWLFIIPEGWLLKREGVDGGISAVAMLVNVLPLSFFAARKLSEWLWPGLVRKADADARLRLANAKSLR